MSTTGEVSNKASFQRFHDTLSTGDADLVCKMIDELADPDVLVRTPLPLKTTGAAALKEVSLALLHAYPDLHLTVEDLIAEDDKVVGRTVVTGTHRGDYLGLAPTGKRVTYDEIFIFRFQDGRIAETWGVVDVLAQLRQLGAVSISSPALP
jgi:steroid delta-isomerase-like uncharacterized protein